MIRGQRPVSLEVPVLRARSVTHKGFLALKKSVAMCGFPAGDRKGTLSSLHTVPAWKKADFFEFVSPSVSGKLVQSRWPKFGSIHRVILYSKNISLILTFFYLDLRNGSNRIQDEGKFRVCDIRRTI